MTFLSSFFINLITFSLVFVYVTGGEPGLEKPPIDPDPGDVVEFVGETDIDEFEILPPADFENASGIPDQEDYNPPQFKHEFDSYLLARPDRGGSFVVRILIQIDKKGKLMDEPKVVGSSGSVRVDTETVRRLKRLKYIPAKHSSTDVPIDAKMTARIFWFPGGG